MKKSAHANRHGKRRGPPVQIEHIRQAVAIDTLDTPVRNRLGQRIQQGLSAGEFHLVFQGIYGARTLELERIEALIRWNHPDYGLLLPDAFVPALHDDLEVAVDVTHFVIDRACAQLATCLRAGQKALPLAVNVPLPKKSPEINEPLMMMLPTWFSAPTTPVPNKVLSPL